MVALWKRNKIIFVFIIAIFLMFPTALSKESIAYTHLICVAIGIDKQEEEYEISLQVVVPKQSNAFNQTLKVVSAKSDTVKEAVDKIKYHVGKEIGFAQCGFIVFNEEASKENILLPIDYLIRTHNLNYNCILVTTDKSANKILELNGNFGQSYSFDLNRILEYNERNLFATNSNIEHAYRSYLSPNKAFATSLVSATDVKSEGVEGEKSSSGQGSGSDSESGGSSVSSSGSGSSSGGNDKEKFLSNQGKLALYNAGKMVEIVDNKEINGIEYLNPYANDLAIKVEDFTSGIFNNATIEIEVIGKKCSYHHKIVGDKLKYKCNVLLYLKLNNINQEDGYEELLDPNKDYFTEELVEQIKKQEAERVQTSINKLKELNLDFVNVYDSFNRWLYDDFQKYLKQQNHSEDYFQNTDFEVEFTIISD